VRLKVWGARGSIPAPGPETMRYGGNTSCIEVTLSDASKLILDAGTGIRNLGLALGGRESIGAPIHILLTHLHMDHIQGLMFFAPLFRPESEITIWGPSSPEASLRDRIARYISAPLAPVEVRELPSLVSFREAEPLEWDIGPARIRAHAVNHRGPTLGYRIEEGGSSLCYIPDHEPGLGAPLDTLDDDWISGFDLAHGASMLVHDCQYTDLEYPTHLGWGHCPVADALAFGRRVAAERMLLFHHDPLHSDADLDAIADDVAIRWQELGGSSEQVELATERRDLQIAGEPAPAR
jgi:phosphoribosyl 1,2-cyclic phosphodiesterase